MILRQVYEKSIRWVNGDLKKLSYVLKAYRPVETGLYTYKYLDSQNWEKRIHLRVESKAGGKLFVDVTDVIHLDMLSTEIVKLALDGCDKQTAKKLLSQMYIQAGDGLNQDIDRLYTVVDHFLEGTDGCQTCALTGLLSRAPLFSLEAGAPYKIDLALTYGCNNQCSHCYNEADRLSMPSLTLNKWREVLNKISEIGIPHVILTGGEATLHPDFLEIVRYADSLGLVVGLNSNGRAISDSKFMHQIAQAGLNHVQITLGSCYPEVHDSMMGARSFHQTVKGISAAVDSGVHVITNTTLIRSNISHVEEIIDFIYERGVRTFAMNGMIFAGGGFANPEALHADELAALLAGIKQHADSKGMRFLWYTPTEYCLFSPFEIGIGVKRCNAGEYSICIEPNGDVLPCQSYYVPVGNILHDSWEQIWESDLFRSFRDRKVEPAVSGLPEECRHCPDYSVCGGGCRIEREARIGIRTADLAGGGCIGCTGYSSDVGDKKELTLADPEEVNLSGGYVPNQSQVSRARRSKGIIRLKNLDAIQKDE